MSRRVAGFLIDLLKTTHPSPNMLVDIRHHNNSTACLRGVLPPRLPANAPAHDQVLPPVHHAGVADLEDGSRQPRRWRLVLKHGKASSAGETPVDHRDVPVFAGG